MKSVLTSLAVVVALVVTSLVQAAPIPTGNGYYGSVTWSTGWGNPQVTYSVGPYATYGDCYTAWMNLAHSYPNPQWWVESMQPCRLYATHQEMLSVEVSLNIGGSGNPVGTVEDAVRIAEEVTRVRREFNADAYEAALQRIR